jgi:predicted Fe-Mo cluster-binding NifX family protein
MKIAIPVWNDRVSPIFDVARTIRVVDLDTDRALVVADSTYSLERGRPTSTLDALGVDLLVCSAISPAVESAVWVLGVEVISDICGSQNAIVQALAAGDEELSRFRSPGSRKKPRRPTIRASTRELEDSKSSG